jgi:4-hydroxyphenylpyruvate dioxygenase-like putative hemolysin
MSEYVIHDIATQTDIDVKVRRHLRRKATRFVVTRIGFSNGTSIRGKIMGAPVAVTMVDTNTATLTIVAEDADGNPAPVAAPPAWTTDDAAATLTPAADGMSCTYTTTATTPTGSVHKVTATGNGVAAGGGADPNDVITQEFDVTVNASEATQFVGSATVA